MHSKGSTTLTQSRRSYDLLSSVKAREEVLLAVIANTMPLTTEISRAVRSTTTFADWVWNSKGIGKIARGTLRKFANSIFSIPADVQQSGWSYLDNLRRSVKAKKPATSSARSVSAKANAANVKRDEQIEVIRSLEAEMLLQSRAYLSLLRQVQGIANSKSVQSATRARMFNILNDHDELYGSLFGPELTVNVRPNNVEKMKR